MNTREYFYKLGCLLYKIDGIYTEIAKKSKIKENELWILYALNDGNEHSQKEISESWDIPKTTINTIMKDLEKRDIIYFTRLNGSKRELLVKLTENGERYASTMLNKIYEKESLVYLKSERAIDTLNGLEQIYKNMKEVFENEKDN